MFSGIIETTTDINNVSDETEDGVKLTFQKPSNWDDLALGESINTNGVCLTITAIREAEYECYVMNETRLVSTFGSKIPNKVNLERALKANGRIDGHFVQGHVDKVGSIKDISKEDGTRLKIQIDPNDKKLLVLKGSVAVDGISLTLSDIESDNFEVSIIPYTLEHTTLGSLDIGDKVNLEFDILGKYVQSNLESYNP
ncbi:MAG: riboflavin synthase [Candidatus Saccharimonadales bacterium]